MIRILKKDSNKIQVSFFLKQRNQSTRRFFNTTLLLAKENEQKDMSHFMNVLNQYKDIDNDSESKFSKKNSPSFTQNNETDYKESYKKKDKDVSSLTMLKKLLEELQEKSGIKISSSPEYDIDYTKVLTYNNLNGLKALPEYLKIEKDELEKIAPILSNLSNKINSDAEFLQYALEYLALLDKSQFHYYKDTAVETIIDPVNKDLVIKHPFLENIKMILWSMFVNDNISKFIPTYRKLQIFETLKREAITKENVFFLRDSDFLNLELILNWNVHRNVENISDVLSKCDEQIIYDYNTLVILTFIENFYYAEHLNRWEEDGYCVDLKELTIFDKIGIKSYLNDLPEESIFTKWYISELNKYQKDINCKYNLMRYKTNHEVQGSYDARIHPKSKLAKQLGSLKHHIFKIRNNDIEL